ncbi:helix-turn-helix domain-containing protein [bacterium]|nr:helix-turn-helix domain-containing protein [bacterium]
MLTVGNLLKKAREHSGKHIEEIAQTIRIKQDYLHKIEQNDFSSFNSSTFVKGFIRSYASFLGLDAENIVALFRRQIGEEDVPLKAKRVITKQQSIVISPTSIISIAIIVFFVGVFGFLLSQFYKLQQPPLLKIAQPISPITTVDSTSFEIKGIVEENSLVSVNGSQIQLRDDNTFSLLVELKEGDNTYTFDAWKKNIEGKHATQVVTLVYQLRGKPTATPTSGTGTATGGKDLSVLLELSGEAWIQVVADSTQKTVGIKSKGYKLDFVAKQMLEVTTGKPAVSTIKLGDRQFPWKIKNGVGSLICFYKEDIADWKCD